MQFTSGVRRRLCGANFVGSATDIVKLFLGSKNDATIKHINAPIRDL
jgi:hypothetical protein